MERMQAAGLDIPVIVGGIIPDEDCQALTKMGIARIYTPKDFDLNQIMLDIVALTA
jgi:(2R)-ethylmalonyl-CoA mutase